MNRNFSFVLVVLLIAAKPLLAQDKKVSGEAMLPEIDPQDIEIRSQFNARFPGLHRQPILGFDPSSRIYQVAPNRKPFMETDEQVVANLPITQLSRPDPPVYSPLYYSEDINAFGRFGIGSFMSSEANFWGTTHLNPKSYIAGDLDFSSSDGHLDDQQSNFRFFNVNAEYATKLNTKTRLGVNGGFENSFNHLFDLDPSINVQNTARNEYDGFHLGGELEHFKNDITGWHAQANMRSYGVTLNGGNQSGNTDELVFNGSVAKRWAGAHTNETFAIKAGARGGNYDNDQFSDNWYTARGGVTYKRLFNYSTDLTADLNLYYGKDAFDSKIYFGPSIKIEQPIVDILKIKAQAGAKPYVKTTEQLHETNRFLNPNNYLRHSYNINAMAEASINYLHLGTLNLGVKYENISDYPIFLRKSNPGDGSAPYLFYENRFADVHRARAYASVVQHIIPERLWVNGKLYLQSPQIKDGGRIPYEEKFGFHSSLGARPIDRITVEAWADYTGPRRTFQTNEKLGGYMLIGGRLDLEVTDQFGAYLKLVNLLSQDYEVWQGYTERPFQVFGGITIKL